ncbi:hypothetical protein [Hoylesella shahii]|uniref:hypothetical protein n=1 Tax=Hoylesella shahii TaxID=228603 RepID=UPI00248EEA2F|nr:hypothetical protein [Hoylesella shahii]
MRYLGAVYMIKVKEWHITFWRSATTFAKETKDRNANLDKDEIYPHQDTIATKS